MYDTRLKKYRIADWKDSEDSVNCVSSLDDFSRLVVGAGDTLISYDLRKNGTNKFIAISENADNDLLSVVQFANEKDTIVTGVSDRFVGLWRDLNSVSSYFTPFHADVDSIARLGQKMIVAAASDGALHLMEVFPTLVYSGLLGRHQDSAGNNNICDCVTVDRLEKTVASSGMMSKFINFFDCETSIVSGGLVELGPTAEFFDEISD